jgi:replicative DNA helicase
MNAFSHEFRPALPDAIEAEAALLGAIMLNVNAFVAIDGRSVSKTSVSR